MARVRYHPAGYDPLKNQTPPHGVNIMPLIGMVILLLLGGCGGVGFLAFQFGRGSVENAAPVAVEVTEEINAEETGEVTPEVEGITTTTPTQTPTYTWTPTPEEARAYTVSTGIPSTRRPTRPPRLADDSPTINATTPTQHPYSVTYSTPRPPILATNAPIIIVPTIPISGGDDPTITPTSTNTIEAPEYLEPVIIERKHDATETVAGTE